MICRNVQWCARNRPAKEMTMSQLLIWIGRLAGLVGAGAAGCAVVVRASGAYHLGSMQLGTLLNAGVAAMVLGALAYAAAMAEFGPPGRR
jgi:hypothetical protein